MKRILSLALFLSLALMAVAKGPKTKTIYLFGFSASFTDSVAFMTPLQKLEGAYIGQRGFLVGRTQYALQLTHYLEGLGKSHMTSCVYFAESEKKMAKLQEKMRKRYIKAQAVALATLPAEAFAFKPVDYVPDLPQ